MIAELLKALVLGGIPVALFTFLVVQWSITSGRMAPFSGSGRLEKQHRQQEKIARVDEGQGFSNVGGDLVHKNVARFGGGYYGTMAVLTYFLIESIEIWQFVTGLFDASTHRRGRMGSASVC